MLRATVSPALHPEAAVVLHVAVLFVPWLADENANAVVPTQKL